MADNSQLPTMPTVAKAGMDFGAALRAPAAAGIEGVRNAATNVGNVISQAPAFLSGVASGLGGGLPAPPVVPTPVPTAPVPRTPIPAANPYAPGGVIPALPSPEAIAAFRTSSLGADPGTVLGRAAAANTAKVAPPVDPQAGQIRFIDKNSPRVAAPNVIPGGVGGGAGITNREAQMVAPLIPAAHNPSERAGHALMDFYNGEHQADIDLAAATATGDQGALAAAQQHKAFFSRPESLRYLMNLKTINLPSFGTTEALTSQK